MSRIDILKPSKFVWNNNLKQFIYLKEEIIALDYKKNYKNILGSVMYL